jgi:CopG-like RHH_1 or ribbon-helix-helix domain, RHH_5
MRVAKKVSADSEGAIAPLEPRKFSVSLPGDIANDLERWAILEGRNRGNLAAHLLESAVRIRFPEKYLLTGYPPMQSPR